MAAPLLYQLLASTKAIDQYLTTQSKQIQVLEVIDYLPSKVCAQDQSALAQASIFLPAVGHFTVKQGVDAKINTLESEGTVCQVLECKPSVLVSLTIQLTR